MFKAVDKVDDKLDEHEQAAITFNYYSSVFRENGYKLANRKKRAVVRVLEKLILEPFEDVKLEGKEEQDLLDICKKLMYCKMKIGEYAILRKENKDKENNNEQ